METKETKGSKIKGTGKRVSKRLKASKVKKALTGYDVFAPSDSPGRIKARAELSKEKGHAVVGNYGPGNGLGTRPPSCFTRRAISHSPRIGLLL